MTKPTTTLISLRLPTYLVEEIDRQANAEQRSRSQVILRRLRGGDDVVDVRLEVRCPECMGILPYHQRGCGKR